MAGSEMILIGSSYDGSISSAQSWDLPAFAKSFTLFKYLDIYSHASTVNVGLLSTYYVCNRPHCEH